MFALAVFCAGLPAAGAEVVGYRGDGTGVYRNCNPPLQFAYPGPSVAWDVPLPAWGHGSPIVVGQRVFVVCEVGLSNDWPLLMCLDAATGKTLWQRELDHLPALLPDPAQRKPIADDWTALRQQIRKLKQAAARTASAEAAVSASDAAESAPAGSIRSGEWPQRLRRLTARGLWHETWNEALFHNTSLACIGFAYATPISDGQFVWAVTSFGGVFCFDLEGQLRWVAALPCPKPANRQSNGSIEHCQNGRSPILFKDMLIADITGYVRALDRKTGRVLFVDDGPARNRTHTIVSPTILRTGGTDVLWSGGCSAYRLPDGKPLKVEGWIDEGIQALTNADQPDIVYFCGSGEHSGWTGKGGVQGTCEHNPPAAVRFKLDGDTLKASVLWHGGALAKSLGLEGRATGDILGGNAPWMLYHAGRFYHRGGAILDGASGKLLAGAFERRGNKRAVPQTSHLLLAAGDHVFGLGRSDLRDMPGAAVMEVFTLDGKPVARNILQPPKLTDEQRKMFAASAGVESMRSFSYSWAFTFAANRIYIRSYANLICIGR